MVTKTYNYNAWLCDFIYVWYHNQIYNVFKVVVICVGIFKCHNREVFQILFSIPKYLLILYLMHNTSEFNN